MEYAEPTVRLKPRKGKADGVQFRKPGYAAAASKPKTAQAVVKVISQARGHRAKVLLNYVARSESEHPLALEDENGLEVKGVDGIQAVYEEWAKDFERAAPGQKRPPRHVTHMIFSGDCAQTPENARAVQSAVAELMREQLGRDGYRYMMVLHTDTDHPHVHVIVNNYNRDKDGPKLRINPPELLVFRQQFAQKMRERGIEQQATRRKDRLSVLEAVAKGIENLQAGGAWYESKLYRAAEAQGRDAPSAEATSAEATPKMLEWAEELAEENGVQLEQWAEELSKKTGVQREATDFETVRTYLDEYSPLRMGLDNNGPDADTKAEKPSPFNSFAKRRDMAKAVARIKEDVKATTLPFSQERRERMALLRKISQELIDPAAPNYRQLVENLSLKLDKDREKIRDHIRTLTDPENPVQDHKRRRQREHSIDKIIARNIEAVQSARLDLVRAPGVGVIEGYKLGYQLKTYERELQRIRRQVAWGAFAKAAPGTTAEVAAERQRSAVLERATRTADKLAALGPWYEPTDAKKAKTFDAFAKRQALTNIATHLADRLEAAGVKPTEPLAIRVRDLRASLVEAPAPKFAPLVAGLQQRLHDTRMRADLDVRRAAHQSTPLVDRDALRAKVRAELTARVDSMRSARRELAETPGVADRERLQLATTLKRMERIATQAARVVDNPRALAGKLAELDNKLRTQPEPQKAPPAVVRDTQPTTARSFNGLDPYAPIVAGYGLKATPAIDWRDNELHHRPAAAREAPQSLDSMRTMSGVGMVGRAERSEVLLPNPAPVQLENVRAAPADGMRRPDNGLGAAGGSAAESGRESGEGSGRRIEPVAAKGDRLTQEQLATLLDRVHSRLVEAGRWDDPTPYRSGHREFYQGDDGKPRAPVLDAFAKRRAMLQDIDQLKPEVDAAHVNFTPDMRRQLAAIRDMRDGIKNAPAKDMESVVNRLAEKLTNDQLRIEKQRDTPATSAVEALERRRQSERVATRNLQSTDDARREVQKAAGLMPMQRIALADRIKSMAKAMEIYSGKSLGK